MKTRNIALILLASAALMLSACANEPEIENGGGDITFDKDESMFRIGSVQTRSSEEIEATTHDVASVTMDNGETFTLRETVTSLDDVETAPETRGTPAFTQNVSKLYKSFYTYAMKEDGSPAFAKTQAAGEGGVKYTLKVEDGNDPSEYIWHYHYGEDIWGEGKLPTYFFMRMPGEGDGVTLGNNPYSWDNEHDLGSITFSYKTPDSAPDQKDILFASYKRTGKTNAEKVKFYHALTGVKFANFFDYSLKEGAYAKAETIIKNIKISGLKNTGTCTVTPNPNPDSQIKSKDVVVWSGLGGSGTYSQDIAYAFADYSQSQYSLAETLNANASEQNLNDNDGTLTFFFIPQTITSDVTIEVTFDITLRTVQNGAVSNGEKTFKDVKFSFKLADKLNSTHLEWKAGELHTFTLWPRAIGVKISDRMNQPTNDTKDSVVVKNTGNTWQYVRVNLIGNWVGQVQKSGHDDDLSNPTILMGYSNAEYASGYTPGTIPPQYANETETAPWNDKDGRTHYGTFTNLVPQSHQVPATADSTKNNWVRYDKYYYYTKAIGPNDAITEPLFDSYTVYTSPNFYIPDIQGVRRLAKNVHLEMDLMVEAIEAPTDAKGRLVYPDGTLIETNTDGYIKAWVAALGLDSKDDLLDLK